MKAWIAIFFPFVLLAADPFTKGCQSYQKGDFDQAIKTWEGMVHQGYEDYRLYYNMGCAYYRLGERGRAILWLKRARQLNPLHPYIQENLDFIQSQLKDKFPSPRENLTIRFLRNILYALPLHTLSMMMLGLYMAFHIFWFFYLLTRRSPIKPFWVYGMTLTACLFIILSVPFSVQIYSTHAVEQGVVLMPSVSARSAPQEDSTMLFVLHEGTTIRLHEKVGSWQRISLPNGLTGFIPILTFEKI